MSHRVVLDTNCVVSALLFSRQRMAWLRYCWQSGDIIPLVNQSTVNELLKVLTYPKFKLTKSEQALLLADYLPYSETVPMRFSSAPLPQVRDAADQIFLTLAVTNHAAILVSGDQDLLIIKDQLESPLIMTLSEFSTWLGQGRTE